MRNERGGYVPDYDPETQVAVDKWEGEGNIPNGSDPIRKGIIDRLNGTSVLPPRPLAGAEVVNRPDRDNVS